MTDEEQKTFFRKKLRIAYDVAFCMAENQIIINSKNEIDYQVDLLMRLDMAEIIDYGQQIKNMDT